MRISPIALSFALGAVAVPQVGLVAQPPVAIRAARLLDLISGTIRTGQVVVARGGPDRIGG